MMWMAIAGGAAAIFGFVFSFAKVSTRAEKITERHREELFNRETEKEE